MISSLKSHDNIYQGQSHRLARGPKAPRTPKISSIPCRFVLREAVSHTRYCCSFEIKIFGSSQNFGLTTLLDNAYLLFNVTARATAVETWNSGRSFVSWETAKRNIVFRWNDGQSSLNIAIVHTNTRNQRTVSTQSPVKFTFHKVLIKQSRFINKSHVVLTYVACRVSMFVVARTLLPGWVIT